MTAEIAILNRSAVAMAADSAVTMQLGDREKIFPTANKIFSLSAGQPVGIMVYGGADFMSVPWETLIKVLRDRLGSTSFPNLKDYAEWFRGALASFPDLIVGNAADDFIKRRVGSYFNLIHESVLQRINEYIEQHKEIDDEQVREVFRSVVSEHHKNWEGGESLPSATASVASRIRSALHASVSRLIEKFFGQLTLSGDDKRMLSDIAGWLFTRRSGIQSDSDSGVVIAGFGTSEIVPALTSMEIRGCLGGVLLWAPQHELSMEDQLFGVIVPFAQTDEVMNFLQGVHPDYQQRLDNDFKTILDKTMDIVLAEVQTLRDEQKSRIRQEIARSVRAEYDAYRERLETFRRQAYSNPILQVLAGTPKDQLAAMAEALVNLTSFKRRVSTQAETVGGPIDVALISKGDGLVWVKRKHYFPPELNPQFLSRYNRGTL